ncbi:hypothetical protein, partial [Oleiphilus sp. HI0066]|uniref:hypothetical protein n=1 Tax=Oleiphilus sp. HI0066 TaxID=1822242 RepID=UPI001E5A89BF
MVLALKKSTTSKVLEDVGWCIEGSINFAINQNKHRHTAMPNGKSTAIRASILLAAFGGSDRYILD